MVALCEQKCSSSNLIIEERKAGKAKPKKKVEAKKGAKKRERALEEKERFVTRNFINILKR